MTHTVLMTVHVAAGALGLLLGPFVMWQQTKRLRAGVSPITGAGDAYHWMVLVTALSSVVLVTLSSPELWFLDPLAVFAYSLVLISRIALARRFHGWIYAYAHGMGGSYIAMVTATL